MKRYDPIIARLPHMIHGGDYNPDQWRDTREVWREDMRLAKLAGINSLSVGIFAWAALEPEDGVYDFGWLDDVMDMLAENGMTAVLATPTGARPAWMSEKYPEVLRVEADRVRNLHGGRHNHCQTSPVYRRKALEINTRLAERYKEHPALGLWHLSNEYSGECHCELCQQAFRDWLKARYGTLDALNQAWWTAFWSHTYTDWSQVESPSPRGERSVHGLVLDWKRFVTHQTIDFMKAEMEPLRRITPQVPCTTNLMRFFDGFDYYAMAKELDVVSWDNYPMWRADEDDGFIAAETAFLHDMFRGMGGGKPFLLMESSPSATNWQPIGKLRRPGGQVLYSLQAVAHGSDSVQYFQFRKSRGSSEKFHGAVVDHVGHEHTRVFRDVADTGVVLSKLDDVVGCATPAEVAVIYDIENRWAIQEMQGFRREKGYVETCVRHYLPFWQAGVPVDVIDSSCPLNGYKLVVAPMLYMLRPGMAEKLRAFVKRGGTLVCTYMTGYVDEHDLVHLGGFPGPLKDVLGVWAEELDGLYDEESRLVTWNGRDYLAREFCELIHPEGAEVLAAWGEDFYEGMAAITRNAYGQGHAYFLAGRMEDDFHRDFYGKLVDGLGIRRTLGDAELSDGVTATVRTDGQREFVFVQNYMPEEQTVDVGEGGVSLLTGKPVSGEVKLPARGLEIFAR